MSKAKSQQSLDQQIRELQSKRNSLEADLKKQQELEQIYKDHRDRFRIVAQQTAQLFYDYDIPSGHLSWWGAGI